MDLLVCEYFFQEIAATTHLLTDRQWMLNALTIDEVISHAPAHNQINQSSAQLEVQRAMILSR